MSVCVCGMHAIYIDSRRKVLEGTCIQYRQSVWSLDGVRLWCPLSWCTSPAKRLDSSLQGAKSVACLSNSSLLFFWVGHHGSSCIQLLECWGHWESGQCWWNEQLPVSQSAYVRCHFGVHSGGCGGGSVSHPHTVCGTACIRCIRYIYIYVCIYPRIIMICPIKQQAFV